MNTNIPPPVLNALYAGHRYMLALRESMMDLSFDSPAMKEIAHHYREWQEHTQEAVDLLEREKDETSD